MHFFYYFQITLRFQVGDDDWGKKYIDNLTKFNVSTTHVEMVKGKNTGTAQINVAENGENQIVIIPGAHDLLTMSDVEKAQEVLEQTKVSEMQSNFVSVSFQNKRLIAMSCAVLHRC